MTTTNTQGADNLLTELQLADAYAKAHAMYCMEDLYGSSKSYTEELLKARHDARGRLAAALAAAAQQPAPSPAPASPLQWTPGPNAFKDWCSQWFGPDSDDTYLANAVHALPAMAQRFAQPAPTAQADTQPAQVLWVSPEQFANFVDTDEAPFGKYIPARKTSAGKFTMPLFAARAPADSALEDAARLDWLEGQSQVNIERVRYLLADTSIYEVTPFNSTDYNGETLRKAIDAARKQGEK